jgi:hypothetical protein
MPNPSRAGAEQARLAVTGVEVSSPGDFTQPEARLAAEGLATKPQPDDLLLRAALSKAGARSQ